MLDLSDYVGIPYRPEGRGRDGCDCWGLVVLVYRERLGIELPSYTGYGDPLGGHAASLIEQGRQQWRPVSTPEPYDAVLIRVHGRPHHIGLVVRSGWMLHAAPGRDSCMENYLRPYWRARIEGFYRWKIEPAECGLFRA